jgi:group I intron endonuclease
MVAVRKVFLDIPSEPGIYIIRCLVNDKIYVGQAVNVRKRFISHRSMLRKGIHRNPHLQNSWNVHGEAHYEFKVLELCAVEDLTQREDRAIVMFGTREHAEGYNIAKAGCSPTLGVGHRPETVAKMLATRRENGNMRLITANGETRTLTEWANLMGMSITGFSDRLKAGRTPEEAVSGPKLATKTYKVLGNKGTIQQLCKVFNIPESRVTKRLTTYGWSLERALTEVNLLEKFVIDGVGKSLPMWCEEYNVPYARTVYRISKGWDLVDALTKPKLGLAA